MAHRIAIMQPYFVPYLGYFRLFQQVDQFVMYDWRAVSCREACSLQSGADTG
ncbi:MAG: WbqC family protein [Gammaproteobacteria bacterium]